MIDNYTFHESGTGGAAHGGMQTGDKNTNTGSSLQDSARVRRKVRKCKQCGFKENDKAALAEHMLVHTAAPPDKAFLLVCAHCEFQCSAEIVLKEHLATHVSLNEVRTLRLLCGFEKCPHKASADTHGREAASLRVV